MLRSITFLLYATIDIWNVWWGLHANQTHTWELAHTNLLVLNLFDYHEIISNWMPNSICQVQIKSNFGLAWFCELNVKKNCSLCMACLRACLYKHTWVYPLVANHVLRHWTTTKKKERKKGMNKCHGERRGKRVPNVSFICVLIDVDVKWIIVQLFPATRFFVYFGVTKKQTKLINTTLSVKVYKSCVLLQIVVVNIGLKAEILKHHHEPPRK